MLLKLKNKGKKRSLGKSYLDVGCEKEERASIGEIGKGFVRVFFFSVFYMFAETGEISLMEYGWYLC